MRTRGVRRRGSKLRLLVVAVLLCGAFLLLVRAFSPWAFYMGGHSHLIPIWTAKGTLHTSSGGDYQLWLYLYPSSSRLGNEVVAGDGTLCTPRGERFLLKLYGGMGRFHSADLEGRQLHLSLHRRRSGWGVNPPDYRPELEFRGQWTGQTLEMDDQGTLARAFLPDGQLYSGPRRPQPPTGESVHVSFHETSMWDMYSGCGAAR
jgi:hypothetical protein